MGDDTESLDDSDDYEYMEGSKMTSPVMSHSKNLPLYPAQPLAVPCTHWQSHKASGATSVGNSPVMSARKGDNLRSPRSDPRNLHSMHGKGKKDG